MAASEYLAWVNMRQRCNNPNHPEYERYGGRGISVCKEWDSYSQFYIDLGEKPYESASIDRKDNSKGYCKDNCEWASKSTQSFNQRLSSDNQSGVIGVYMEKQTCMWKAYIRTENKQITLGRFRDFFEAVCARKSAELKYYKEVLERA